MYYHKDIQGPAGCKNRSDGCYNYDFGRHDAHLTASLFCQEPSIIDQFYRAGDV